jgi:hypothetical protein
MTSRSDYFKEYNKKPERKNYLKQKSKQRYHLLKEKKLGVGKFSCPNCKTTYFLQKRELIIETKGKRI